MKPRGSGCSVGIDGFWGPPHYTRTEYYRTGVTKMANKPGLFEFVVPMAGLLPGRKKQ